MSKELLNEMTGEIIEEKDIQVVSMAIPAEIKFKTNYTNNEFGNANEVNSGEYIIDDSQYIDFKKLLLDSAKRSKTAKDFLSKIPVVDDVGGIAENDLEKVISESQPSVNVDNSAELSTSTTEGPQEATEVVNPVDNSTDVASEAETNSKQ